MSEEFEEEELELYVLLSKFMDAVRSAMVDLTDTLDKVWGKIIEMDTKLDNILKEKKKIRKVSPGFGLKVVKELEIENQQKVPKNAEIETIENSVVKYTKKDGTDGYKLKNAVTHEGKDHKYISKCKYDCGYWVSWDNYKKGMKPLHINPDDFHVYGRSCPKYD